MSLHMGYYWGGGKPCERVLTIRVVTIVAIPFWGHQFREGAGSCSLGERKHLFWVFKESPRRYLANISDLINPE